MIVCGVDLGFQKRKFAAAVLDLSQPNRVILADSALFGRESKHEPWEVILARLSQDFQAFIARQTGLSLVVYELAPYVQNHQTVIRLAHFGGMVMTVAAQQGIDLIHVAPAQVKIALTGQGDAKKPAMKRAAKTLLGLNRISEDLADAVGAALAGAAKHRETYLKEVYYD